MAYNSLGTDPGKKKKTSVTLHFQKGKTKTNYKSASAETGHPAYGKVGTGAKLEPMLSKARAAKVEVVHDKEGKPYRAGFASVHKEPDTHTTKLEHTPEIPKRVKSSYETIQTKQKTADIRDQNGPAMKRRLPRVDYFQGKGYGKNKRTESGFGK